MVNKTILRKFLFYQSLILLLGFGVLFGIFYYSLLQYKEYTVTLSAKLLNNKFEQELQSSSETAASLLGKIYQLPDFTEDQKLALAQELIGSARFGDEGYFFAVENGTGLNLIHGAKPELQGTNLWDSQDSNNVYYIRQLNEAATTGSTFVKYEFPKLGATEASPKLGAAISVPGTNMWVGTGRYIDSIEADKAIIQGDITAITNRTLLEISTVFGILLVVVLGVVGVIVKRVTQPIREIVEVAQAVALGNLDHQITIHQRDEVGQLADAFRQMIAYLQNMAEIATGIAASNLTQSVTLRSEKDKLATALQRMIDNLNKTLGQINVASDQVVMAVNQVQSVSQDLAANAEEQSSAVEEITANLEETEAQVRLNADNASTANQLASETGKAANAGQQKMAKMTEAMDGIVDSSREIAKIIKVIDEIAFQTNLLALNAAVEAARAGQHGRGFAVVAQEVRNLAGRSAKAAKETAELIEDAGRRVAEGVTIAGATRDSLNEIVQNVIKVKDLVAEIAAASDEQTKGLSQISSAMVQVNAGAQSGSQQSEELASTADELGNLADRLRDEIKRFKLREEQTGLSNLAGLTINTLPPYVLEQITDLIQQSDHSVDTPASRVASKTNGKNGKHTILSLDQDDRGYNKF